MKEFSQVGSVVKYLILDTNEIEENEITDSFKNSSHNAVSLQSPLGDALWGRQVGEKVFVNAPNPYEIEIKEIKNSTTKNIRKEKMLFEKSSEDSAYLIAGKSYGTNTRKIYEHFCKTLNWDMSKIDNFGRQGVPLHAEKADTDRKRDIWFLCYHNANASEDIEVLDYAPGANSIDIIKGDGETIIESVNEEYWGKSNLADRITFAKNKETGRYEFLGVYEVTNSGEVRVYKRISNVYPLDLLD